jgi:hypothetical protein
MGSYLLVSHFVVLYLGMVIMSIKKMKEVRMQKSEIRGRKAGGQRAEAMHIRSAKGLRVYSR